MRNRSWLTVVWSPIASSRRAAEGNRVLFVRDDELDNAREQQVQVRLEFEHGTDEVTFHTRSEHQPPRLPYFDRQMRSAGS